MIESLTLEDALELFKLPRLVGTFETKEIKANTGRFGPYLQHDGKFVSIPKGEDPMVINEARAIELIEAKRKVESERLIKSFKENADVQVLNGRWGPYFVIGKNNYKLPKDTDAKAITLVECLALAKEQDAAPKKTSKGKFAKKAK
jgi:DNA topoisomerase-1